MASRWQPVGAESAKLRFRAEILFFVQNGCFYRVSRYLSNKVRIFIAFEAFQKFGFINVAATCRRPMTIRWHPVAPIGLEITLKCV